MIGPVIFGAALLYLLLSILVVRRSIGYARNSGKSAKRWGWGAVLVMYLIPFWDWLPTVVMHQYYCVNDSGFVVYKTFDQWKAENPRVIESLPAPSATGSPAKHERSADGHEKKDTYVLNERINWLVSQRDISNYFPIILTEQIVKDAKKNEVLARYVDFATGNSVMNTIGPPGPIKFWLHSSNCGNGASNQDALGKFRDNFYGSKR